MKVRVERMKICIALLIIKAVGQVFFENKIKRIIIYIFFLKKKTKLS
jgi:hypothetical protein